MSARTAVLRGRFEMHIGRGLARLFNDPPKHHSKRGRKFTFHGSFKHKADAVRKEQATAGAFIQERNGRFVVMTENR
jgi:hypothetical protein